jgi:hypothetical protein
MMDDTIHELVIMDQEGNLSVWVARQPWVWFPDFQSFRSYIYLQAEKLNITILGYL